MNKGCFSLGITGLVGAAFILLWGAFYTVDQTKQVIITQFGKPVGQPIVTPGLHMKIPLIQDVIELDTRFLEWDGASVAIPTKDKTYIHVDAFGRWRIKDPLLYFVRIRDESSARSRLDDILGSEIRNAVARHELIEIVRTQKDRKPMRDESLVTDSSAPADIGVLRPIEYGRLQVEGDIKAAAAAKLSEFGIELLDVRLKRVNYNSDVLDRIYQRMISERLQIAERFRSEGQGKAARIAGNKQRELDKIQSNAYRQVETIRGEADAKASEIYAQAYTQSPQASEFFSFSKSLETYRRIISKDSTLVLSTDSDLFKLLKRIDAGQSIKPPVTPLPAEKAAAAAPEQPKAETVAP